MLTTLLYCLTFAWDPATGPVDHYKVFIDDTEVAATQEAKSFLCFEDLQPHYVSVQAFDAEGIPGPMSDNSEEVRMVVEPPFYARPVDLGVQSDLDGNGVVGFEDFGIFGTHYLYCNDGVTSEPPPCLP